MVFVDSGAATGADLRQAVASFTDVDVQTRAAWIEGEVEGIKEALAVFYAFLALSVVVSLFGMVNTLVLSVFERTREIGMLRAVGMSRRQLRRTIRHESIITALIGAALAIPLGVFLAAVVTRGLSSEGVSLHVPAVQLAHFAGIAVAAGLWAAVLPARRAARLDVLEALQDG
jgi:putative ABC transport system permease protein